MKYVYRVKANVTERVKRNGHEIIIVHPVTLGEYKYKVSAQSKAPDLTFRHMVDHLAEETTYSIARELV